MSTPEVLQINSTIFGIAEEAGALGLIDDLRNVSEENYQHSIRTGVIARGIAQYLGRSKDFADVVGFAGLVHDVGKADPKVAALIAENRPLSDDEKTQVGQHTYIGMRFLQRLLDVRCGSNNTALILPAMYAAHNHHEDLTTLTNTAKEVELATVIVQVADRVDARYDPSRARYTNRVIRPSDDIVRGSLMVDRLLRNGEVEAIDQSGEQFKDVPRFGSFSYRNVLSYAHSVWTNVYQATAQSFDVRTA